MGKPGFPILLPVGAASPPHREGLGGRSLPKNQRSTRERGRSRTFAPSGEGWGQGGRLV